jgi:cell division protein FtsI (penicillin-binding protein 3)
MTEDTKNIRKDLIWRVNFIYFIMLIFAFSIIGRILYLQIIEKDKWELKAQEFTRKDIVIEPNRGDILSSDGKLLVSSVPYYDIRMDLNSSALSSEVFDNNIDSLAWNLSNLFRDLSKKEYKRRIVSARKMGSRYFLLKRNVSYLDLKKLKTFPIFRLGKYKGGFIIIQKNKRIKPFGQMASRTLGYLIENNKGERIGSVGVEGAYNKELKGLEGIKLMQKLSGNVWMEIDGGVQVEPEDGQDIISTIDVKMQDVTYEALLKQLIDHDAQHGTAIIMEVATGHIKAISNLEKGKNGTYQEYYNYAIGESSEPGSTFKLASIIVALEDGLIDINDSVDTENGKIKYFDRVMQDSHEDLGVITIKKAFEESSNVGISKIIYKNYKNNPKKFVQRLYEMNLNQKLGLSLKGEGSPFIKYPGDKLWSGVSLPWMSIGYEIQITPMQILTFYNAVANNGEMVKPLFVKEILYHGKSIKKFEKEIINPKICSQSTLEKVHELLEGVVLEGTAKIIKNDNYSIAGKTGTAQVAKRNKGYVDAEGGKSHQASFVGYFPADNPKYSCIVVVNSPSKSSIYGSQVAAPVFKKIADKIYATNLEMDDKSNTHINTVPYTLKGNIDDLENIFSSLNIPYKKLISNDWVSTINAGNLVSFGKIDYINSSSLIPDLKGMGLKDVLYILENKGLKVRAEGYGNVAWQSMPAGSKINEGDNIIVLLR